MYQDVNAPVRAEGGVPSMLTKVSDQAPDDGVPVDDVTGHLLHLVFGLARLLLGQLQLRAEVLDLRLLLPQELRRHRELGLQGGGVLSAQGPGCATPVSGSNYRPTRTRLLHNPNHIVMRLHSPNHIIT